MRLLKSLLGMDEKVVEKPPLDRLAYLRKSTEQAVANNTAQINKPTKKVVPKPKPAVETSVAQAAPTNNMLRLTDPLKPLEASTPQSEATSPSNEAASKPNYDMQKESDIDKEYLDKIKEEKDRLDKKSSIFSKTKDVMSPEVQEEFRKQYESLPEFTQRQAAIDNLKNLEKQRLDSMVIQPNFKNALALSDALWGRNRASSYEAPKNQNPLDTLASYQEKINKLNEDNAKAFTDYIKATSGQSGVDSSIAQTLMLNEILKSGTSSQNMSEHEYGLKQLMGGANANPGAKFLNDTERYSKKAMEDLDQITKSLNSVRSLISSGKKLEAANMLVGSMVGSIIKGSFPGSLSDYESKLALPTGSLKNTIINFYDNLMGDLPNSELAAERILKTAEAVQKSGAEMLRKNLQRRANAYKRIYPNADPAIFDDIANIYLEGSGNEGSTSPMASTLAKTYAPSAAKPEPGIMGALKGTLNKIFHEDTAYRKPKPVAKPEPKKLNRLEYLRGK